MELAEISRHFASRIIFWVRETWQLVCALNGDDYIYRATDKWNGEWRPSIFMPKEASRITLEVTDVRVQRIQDISEEDVLAEGINCISHGMEGNYYSAFRTEPDGQNWCFPEHAFKELWDSINAKRGFGWNVNPWVWVYTFKLLEVKK